MSTESERQRYADEIAKDWIEKGKLIEGGFRVMRQLMLRDMDHSSKEAFEAAAHKIFFLGADHLFSTIIRVMDDGHEPTDDDMKRMTLLHEELAAFRLSLASTHAQAGTA